MTKAIRTTILATLAIATMSLTLQPAFAGGGGKIFIKNPQIIKPMKPWHPKKPHHHHHNDGTAAALGLLGGMIIGGAIASSQAQTVQVGPGNAHFAWCINRYKSYDIGSDTYMSNSGHRKYCNSPYN